MQCNCATGTTYSRIYNADEYRVFGEVAVTCSKYPGTRSNILRAYTMCNIYDVGFRCNPRNNTFHYAYIPITSAEVGHKSDNWTRIREILLIHTLLDYLSYRDVHV